MSFDDAEWQLKKVNAELKKVNREINDLREIVTALQQGESLTEALGAVESLTEALVHKRHYLEWTPLVDHILKNDFWEEVAETDEECPRYDAIYAPKPGEVWRLGTAWNDQSEILPNGNDFVTALEKHPYVDTVQTHEFGCVTVITFHALGNKFDWHYKFDLYQVGDVVQEVMYTACRWPDEGYSTP